MREVFCIDPSSAFCYTSDAQARILIDNLNSRTEG